MDHAAGGRPRERLAFLISVSGAGVAAAETTIDQAQNEMTARGMQPEIVADWSDHEAAVPFARTGQGWARYAAAREGVAARLGGSRPTRAGDTDHPYWQSIRGLYFYDPAPTLRQLQVPVLALFGELDNNIVAEKNKAAWEAASKPAATRTTRCESCRRRITFSGKRRSEATRR